MNSLFQLLTQSFGKILQDHLFPVLREELGAMSERHEQFVRALTVLQLDGFVSVRQGRGRRPHDGANIARAFVAKAVFNFPHTRALLDRLSVDVVLRRLCGWETVAQIPDETIFSRAFAEFAASEFPQQVHAGLIQRTQTERIIGHSSRDSTAIEAREKAQPKPKVAPPAKPARGSHHKTKKAKSPEQMTRLDRQCSGTMTLEEMLSELPRACDAGCKTNSKGNKTYWVGYKLHLDVADGQIPISCVLTSASLNDTQVAVPLAVQTAQRVTSLYDLMDAGYVSAQIREHSMQLGHVPIIPRRKDENQPPLAPHEVWRFRERTTVERVYARLKEEFGGRFVRVRGGAKAMAHLMFGILALTADEILRWIAPPEMESPPIAA